MQLGVGWHVIVTQIIRKSNQNVAKFDDAWLHFIKPLMK